MGSGQFMSRMFAPGAWGALEVLMWVVIAIVAIAMVVLVLQGVGGASGDSGRGGGTRSALEVLEDRYARGEISDEEFDRRRQSLTRTG